jgi:hypothetical protein
VSVGAFAAFAAVTLISLGVGCGLQRLLPATVVPLAAAPFTLFGLKLLVDAQRMGAGEEEEREAQEAIEQAKSGGPISSTGSAAACSLPSDCCPCSRPFAAERGAAAAHAAIHHPQKRHQGLRCDSAWRPSHSG